MRGSKKKLSINNKEDINNFMKYYMELEDEIINVITEPYKSQYIINEIIKVNKDKKLLCITDNEEIMSFKKESLTVLSMEDWTKPYKDYDVVIIDDISVYSRYGKAEFIEIVDYFYNRANKIVIFSIEAMFKGHSSIYVTTQDKENSFIEPRIIISKLNLKKKMPDVVLQYFEYFNRLEQNTIIYVNKDERDLFYDNLNKYMYIFDDIKLYKDVNNKEILKLISKNGNQMIITEDIDLIIDEINNTNIIVYSSSREFFTYKKIIFICGRLSLIKSNKEMIIVSKEDSYVMDISKNIARTFNKIVWE